MGKMVRDSQRWGEMERVMGIYVERWGEVTRSGDRLRERQTERKKKTERQTNRQIDGCGKKLRITDVG